MSLSVRTPIWPCNAVCVGVDCVVLPPFPSIFGYKCFLEGADTPCQGRDQGARELQNPSLLKGAAHSFTPEHVQHIGLLLGNFILKLPNRHSEAEMARLAYENKAERNSSERTYE